MGDPARQVMQDVIDRQYAEIARLTAEVSKAEELMGKLINANDAITAKLNDSVIRAETAEAQLADLRARVRPGVEEIKRLIVLELIRSEDEENLWLIADKQAQAIHAILPPVPKVMTVEEITEDEMLELMWDVHLKNPKAQGFESIMYPLIAQAIHATLPPVPKELSVEELCEIIMFGTANHHKEPLGLLIRKTAVAIHKAIYGGEE